jgi:hypothetical protein
MQPMKTQALTKLIADCWLRAEQALINAIKQEYPDRDEEMVTDLFCGKLDTECKRISAAGEVERAFLADLRLSLPLVPTLDLPKIARGLIATVHFHPREREQKTGGDFGVVLIRPDVHYSRFSQSELTINDNHQRGLLCQAKIFRRTSTWGTISPSQQSVLKDKLDYLALVLYRYLDQDGGRRELAPFQWQLTRNSSMKEISGWLADDTFPKLEGSVEILRSLGQDKIGTDNKDAIAKYIGCPVRSSLTIRLGWRDARGPGSTVKLHRMVPNQQVLLNRGE